MARKPRDIRPGVIQAIVIRTMQSRFLLRPSARLNELIIGVIAKAQQRYPDVSLFIPVVLSNHMHLLLCAPDAKLVADFMEYVDGNIAREAGRKHNWRDGRFWSSPYKNTNVVDDDAVLRQLEYHLAQGCKEGLVADPREWPGVHGSKPLCEGKRVMRGKWIDRTGLYRARLRGECVTERDFTEDVELVLSPIPQWRHLTPAQYAARCRALVEKIKDKARTAFKRFAGTREILRQNPHGRPNTTKRGKRPLCHASTKESWAQFLKEHWEFVLYYRLASRQSQRRLSAYPPNSFLPGKLHVPA